MALFEFVSDTANTGSGDGFLALYSEFISQFENKFNQVMLARIIVAIGNTLLDPSETLRLYSSTLEKEARLGPAATLLLKCELGMARLKHGDSEGLKEAIEEGKSQLDEISGSTADTCVHSAFYKLASDFHKIAGPPEEYYHNALKYLTYTPLETMPRDQQFQMATDIRYADPYCRRGGSYSPGSVFCIALLLSQGMEFSTLGKLWQRLLYLPLWARPTLGWGSCFMHSIRAILTCSII